MGDQRQCFGQQGQIRQQRRILLKIAIARHCANPHHPFGAGDPAQRRNRPQIDQLRRVCDAEIHHRHQALAPGQQCSIAAARSQCRHRLIQTGWAQVIEIRRFHSVLSPL